VNDDVASAIVARCDFDQQSAGFQGADDSFFDTLIFRRLLLCATTSVLYFGLSENLLCVIRHDFPVARALARQPGVFLACQSFLLSFVEVIGMVGLVVTATITMFFLPVTINLNPRSYGTGKPRH
jgi:hypothetical protein